MAVNGVEIKVGQRWRTRGGGVATVVKHDSNIDGYPWVAEEDGSNATFTDEGRQLGGTEQPADLIELVVAETAAPEGFTPWAGGEQPEETKGGFIAVVMRSGRDDSPNQADNLRWNHLGLGGDVLAYKMLNTVQRAGTEPSAPELLDRAAGHMRDRAATYDKPGGERSMAQTVSIFNLHHGTTLTEAQGWHFQQILKDVRLFTKKDYHADSAEDCIAYSALKAEALAKGGAK